MPRKSSAQRQPTQDTATVPEILIPPNQAKPSEREAYWIELIDNPASLRAAMETTEFWPMLQEFPASLWGNHLSIYLYRLEDDGGIMVKNAEGSGKYIKPIIRQVIDEEWVANRHGGGKYQAWLKWDNRDTLRKHTFRIDGPPKVQEGQIVEVQGKTVSLSGQANTPPPAESTDVAKVIEAANKVNESSMRILENATEKAMGIVESRAAHSESTQRDPVATALEIIKALQPAQSNGKSSMAEALEIVDRLDAMAARRNPAPEHTEKDTPLNETLEAIKSITGKESIVDLLKPAMKAEASDPYSWVGPVVNAATNFFQQLPVMMRENRLAKQLEFERAVWARNAKPGEAPPAHLLNPAAPAAPHAPAAPATIVPPGPMPPEQIAGAVVNLVVMGFRKNPHMGYQCAAAIDMQLGEQIEAAGLDQWLADETQIENLVKNSPPLMELAKDARWKAFQEAFLTYTDERWGAPEDETLEQDKSGPQPVA